MRSKWTVSNFSTNDQFYMTNFIWPTFVIYLVWRKAFWLTSRSNWSYVSHFIELSHFYAISYEPYHIYAAGNHNFFPLPDQVWCYLGQGSTDWDRPDRIRPRISNFCWSSQVWSEFFKFFLVPGPDRTARSWTNRFGSVDPWPGPGFKIFVEFALCLLA